VVVLGLGFDILGLVGSGIAFGGSLLLLILGNSLAGLFVLKLGLAFRGTP
jgi:hypothetical protein